MSCCILRNLKNKTQYSQAWLSIWTPLLFILFNLQSKMFIPYILHIMLITKIAMAYVSKESVIS